MNAAYDAALWTLFLLLGYLGWNVVHREFREQRERSRRR